MTLISREELLADSSGVLMVLEKYSLSRELGFKNAYRELERYISERADSSYTWGYFPAFVEPGDDYTHCKKLQNELKEDLISQFPAKQHDLELAFIRAASQKPISEFGGLHIDADKGVMHHRNAAAADMNILRVLINLDKEHSRKLGYTAETADELRQKGIDIPHTHYQEIKLPKNIKMKMVEIPPREDGFLYALKFWSDIIPHAGITDDHGHFLAAYGKFADKSSPL